MAYGHGISVNLVQLARAYTMFATDGELKPVTLLKTERRRRRASGDRGRETARAVRQMLEMAVQPGRHGAQGADAGLSRRRQDRHRAQARGRRLRATSTSSSFVGFAPASTRGSIVAVMLDEPGAGELLRRRSSRRRCSRR